MDFVSFAGQSVPCMTWRWFEVLKAHHGKESLCGFPDLRKTQRLLKVLSEGRFVAVLQVSCLSS